ncbi:hypothetical protein BP6252_12088 [Coleophoma cylindrospora]|uniref:C2H2-type domain-containing protein n=1 Tax=Coleophoma cylindrospora TaxID=1849047 RepID=A0A3D8QFX6_9HELO|nr:hypothetical protein BP6252_12088 [Coleophoma cylindrospora]
MAQDNFDKWFEIWEILFPDLPPPNTPWYEPQKVRPSELEDERPEWAYWQSLATDTEPISISGIEDDLYNQTEAENLHEVPNVNDTPSITSNYPSRVSTASSHLCMPLLDNNLPGGSSIPIKTERESCDFTTNDINHLNVDNEETPMAITGNTFIADTKLEIYEAEESENNVIQRPNNAYKPGIHNNSQTEAEYTMLQSIDIDLKAAINPPLEVHGLPGANSTFYPNHQTLYKESIEDFLGPNDNRNLIIHNTPLESERYIESNIERWLQEPVDTFEVTRLAVSDTLADVPELLPFAISLFESQKKLQDFALSPGVISCATEDTSAQSQTPPASQGPTGKRKAQSQRISLQSDRIPGEDTEDEEKEDPRQKRLKRGKYPEDGSRKEKFGCPFHKRHPTIYCLSKDPNLGTREQKKWSQCGGQGFPYLRHLIEEHLVRHQIFDCKYCFKQFDDANENLCHRLDGTCTSTEPRPGPRRDGIEPLQWQEIQKIHRKRTTRIYTDSDKWMEVWTVIFPEIPRPRDPWSSEVDDMVQLPASTSEIESLINTWKTLYQAEILANPDDIFDKETFDRLEKHLRRAFEMNYREREMNKHRVTSMPTPSCSSVVPSAPFSTVERGYDEALIAQSWNNSLDSRKTSIPSAPAPLGLASSPSYTRFLSSQVSGTPSAQEYHVEVPQPSNQVYQSARSNQSSSPLPSVQNLSYGPGGQLQRLEEPLNQSPSTAHYFGIESHVFNTPAQPTAVNQDNSHYGTAYLAPGNRHPTPQIQRIYNQNAMNVTDRKGPQEYDMFRPFPGSSVSFLSPAISGQDASQADLVRKAFSAAFSSFHKTMASSVPFVQSGDYSTAPSVQSMSPPSPQREIRQPDRDFAQESQPSGPNSVPQTFHRFNPESLATTGLGQNSLEGQVPESEMHQRQHFHASSRREAPQMYNDLPIIEYPIQGYPKNYNNSQDQRNLMSQPQQSISSVHQIQVQPPEQHVSDNSDLNNILGLNPGEIYETNFN